MRATTVNSDASFTSYGDSRGTIIRAHTSLYTAANAGVLGYVATGDMTIRGIQFVGTGAINGNSSIGLQLGSSGTARTHENDTGQNVSGLTIEHVTMYTFITAWQGYSLNEGYFDQVRFESNTTAVEWACNLVTPSAQSWEFTRSVWYASSRSMVFGDGNSACTHVGRVFGGEWTALAASSQQVLYVPVTAGNTFFVSFIGTQFVTSGASSYLFDIRGNYTNMVNMRILCQGCRIEAGTLRFGRTAGAPLPSNLVLADVRARDFVLDANFAYNVRIHNSEMVNTNLQFRNATNFSVTENLLQNNTTTTGVNVNSADNSGRIVGNTFDNVTTPLAIFDSSTNDGIRIYDNIGITAAPLRGIFRSDLVAFASLGTPANASESFCTDCTVTGAGDNTCVGSGSGAKAVRINSVWRCFNAQN